MKKLTDLLTLMHSTVTDVTTKKMDLRQHFVCFEESLLGNKAGKSEGIR